MRLKTFAGPDLASAMSRVRAELGPDTVIVSVDDSAGETRVVAAVDRLAPEDEFLESVVLRAPESARPHWDEAIGDALDRHGVPPRLAGRIMGAARTCGLNDTVRSLGAALTAVFRFSLLETGKSVLAIGPYGAGKTATIGKLAARAAIGGRSVGLITTDISRGVDQLRAYARLFSAELIAVEDCHALGAARAALRHKDVILIDTPGFDPNNKAECAAMAEIVAAADAQALAVLPTGHDPQESAEFACRLSDLGAIALAVTRLDVSRRMGNLLAAAAHLPLAEAGIGPSLADGLDICTPELLATWLLRKSEGDTALKGAA